MGSIVIVVYRPRSGREAQLMDAIRDHLPILRAEGLATDREPVVARSRDGMYLEIFEWVSAEAIRAAHTNEAVQALWQRFDEACEYGTLADLAEAGDMFANFEPVDPAGRDTAPAAEPVTDGG